MHILKITYCIHDNQNLQIRQISKTNQRSHNKETLLLETKTSLYNKELSAVILKNSFHSRYSKLHEALIRISLRDFFRKGLYTALKNRLFIKNAILLDRFE